MRIQIRNRLACGTTLRAGWSQSCRWTQNPQAPQQQQEPQQQTPNPLPSDPLTPERLAESQNDENFGPENTAYITYSEESFVSIQQKAFDSCIAVAAADRWLERGIVMLGVIFTIRGAQKASQGDVPLKPIDGVGPATAGQGAISTWQQADANYNAAVARCKEQNPLARERTPAEQLQGARDWTPWGQKGGGGRRLPPLIHEGCAVNIFMIETRFDERKLSAPRLDRVVPVIDGKEHRCIANPSQVFEQELISN